MSIARQRQMRRLMTPPERAMWRLLRPFRDKGVHFRRQVALGPYYTDFAVLGLKLVIEVDGDTHHIGQGPAHDARRDAYLAERGFRELRFSNVDVLNEGEGVYGVVEDALLALGALTPTPDPSPQGGGKPQLQAHEQIASGRKPPAYTLRDATPDDADWINWLEEHCMRAYAEALWGEWHSSIEKYGFDPGRHRIVVADGVECGVIDIRKFEDHWFLSKLYLVEHVRGEGLGAALLKQVREEAAAAGQPLRLSVITTNPRAFAFYKREGFSEISRTNEHILMQRGC